MNLTVEQILALAPDPSSAAAVEKLAGPKPWRNRGHSRSPREVDWDRTIRKSLKNYQRDQTIIVERLVGHGRKGNSLRDVVLCFRPKWFNGHIGCVLRDLRGGVGLDPICEHSYDRLRHERGRSDL